MPTARRLPARWVIRTVTGVQHRRGPPRCCYTTSVAGAASLGARSVVYPLISSGLYRRPKDDAITQALTVPHAEPTTAEVVRLVLFDERTQKLRNASIRPQTTVGDTRLRSTHSNAANQYLAAGVAADGYTWVSSAVRK